MIKRGTRFILILCAVVLLLCSSISAFAEVELPDGTVAGLPEELTVLDEDGKAVNSDTGEYFFEVEDMIPGEQYSKNIQIMNLREDKAYHIYFYALPVDKSGEIDLEQECTTTITLEGEQLYQGLVTGEGNVDMTDTPLDLGLYEPGQSRTLSCSVTWNAGDSGGFIDYGHKLIDENGTTILRTGSGEDSIYGEVRYKWIFYAIVDEDYEPPKTGLSIFDAKTEVILLSVMSLLVCGMLVLVVVRKRKENNRNDLK